MIDDPKKRFIERNNKQCDVWIFTDDEVRELIKKGKSPLTRAFLSLAFFLKDKDVSVETLKFKNLCISDNAICITEPYKQHIRLPDWVTGYLMEYLEEKICEPENLVFPHPLDDTDAIGFAMALSMLRRLVFDNIETQNMRERHECRNALYRAIFGIFYLRRRYVW